jgi:hypothetical protein
MWLPSAMLTSSKTDHTVTRCIATPRSVFRALKTRKSFLIVSFLFISIRVIEGVYMVTFTYVFIMYYNESHPLHHSPSSALPIRTISAVFIFHTRVQNISNIFTLLHHLLTLFGSYWLDPLPRQDKTCFTFLSFFVFRVH